MKMKSLQSVAHAAGYAMAPSEEQFHAPDGMTTRAYSASELSLREAPQRASVPALPAPRREGMAESWVKTVLGSVFAGRATA
ncbi:MAG: hypothetical protein KDJ47_01715 [Hyphomicrobiaceae bacterium]|nr:hypothetical protein [Hyphomicrobiaceae bacterium]